MRDASPGGCGPQGGPSTLITTIPVVGARGQTKNRHKNTQIENEEIKPFLFARGLMVCVQTLQDRAWIELGKVLGHKINTQESIVSLQTAMNTQHTRIKSITPSTVP